MFSELFINVSKSFIKLSFNLFYCWRYAVDDGVLKRIQVVSVLGESLQIGEL